MTLSKTRQPALTADIPIVQKLYRDACEKWGTKVVDRDLGRLWNLRCMWGMTEELPFRTGMEARTLKEFNFVVRTLCGYGEPR